MQAYGLKFLLIVEGRAGKFDLKNTVIVLVTGLGLLGLSTMFCDFVLLNYSSERKKVNKGRIHLALPFSCHGEWCQFVPRFAGITRWRQHHLARRMSSIC